MNILLVEDNFLKKKIIEVGLTKLIPNVNIKHFNNSSGARDYIDDNNGSIDLLILDWCFPKHNGESAHDGEGHIVLDHILDNGYGIKTVICSGNDLSNTTLMEDYYFLLGIIQFGECNPGPTILGLYTNYLTSVCNINRSEKPYVKKLVNYDVK